MDFPDVVKLRKLKKVQKLQAKNEQHSTLKALNMKTYDRLIQACADLVYHRRDTRNAFNKWLLSVEMNGTKSSQLQNANKCNGPTNNSSTQDPSFSEHEKIVWNNNRLFEDREISVVDTYAAQFFQTSTDR